MNNTKYAVRYFKRAEVNGATTFFQVGDQIKLHKAINVAILLAMSAVTDDGLVAKFYIRDHGTYREATSADWSKEVHEFPGHIGYVALTDQEIHVLKMASFGGEIDATWDDVSCISKLIELGLVEQKITGEQEDGGLLTQCTATENGVAWVLRNGLQRH